MKPLHRAGQHYARLLKAYGEQGWWPARTRFEIMVGAVLTQNTSWSNVEKAISALRCARMLTPSALHEARVATLEKTIRSCGYFRVKARRLKALVAWVVAAGGIARLARRPTAMLREDLLAVHGVGPETCDDILLYAFGRPVFVIDAYTRRIFARLGEISGDEPYDTLRGAFESALPTQAAMLGDFHGLLVRLAKEHCQARPRCPGCPLGRTCPSRQPP